MVKIFQPMLLKVPMLLVWVRFVLAPLMLWNAGGLRSPAIFVTALIGALVSDIYDGVLARRLGVSSPGLRRFDSMADVVFYVASLLSIWIVHPEVVLAYSNTIVALLCLEVLGQFISLVKYRRTAAAHAYSAKVWGIFLFIAFCEVLGFGEAGPFFKAMLVVGFVAYADWIFILLLDPGHAVDVSSAICAWKKRHGTLHFLSAARLGGTGTPISEKK